MKNKELKKQQTGSILEKINTGNAKEKESSTDFENTDKNKKPNKGETGKALQMNENSNQDINTDKKD